MDKDAYQIIDGLKCYAPALVVNNPYYPAADFKWLEKVEGDNFWFKGRQAILRFLYQKYVDQTQDLKFLEVGCGLGGLLRMFSAFPNLKLSGADVSLDSLKFIRPTLPQVELAQVDATDLPYQEEFDVIGAFDVIEHIADDQKALVSLARALKKSGLLFITVPQHAWLWSQADKLAGHERRYSKQELIDKIKAASLEVVSSNSLVFSLLPVLIIARLLGGHKNDQKSFALPKFINQGLYLMMRLDLWLIKKGLVLPAGGSLVLIARKK